MNGFQFRLEKVLAWRRTQLDLAEAHFERQTAAVAALASDRAGLETAGTRAGMAIREWDSVTGSDLAALEAFRRGLRKRGEEMDARIAAARRDLEERRAAMLEARRRCRLLERLKERRLAEWTAAADREIEQLAGESHSFQRSALNSQMGHGKNEGCAQP
jgi:flagellar export protein FliJ